MLVAKRMAWRKWRVTTQVVRIRRENRRKSDEDPITWDGTIRDMTFSPPNNEKWPHIFGNCVDDDNSDAVITSFHFGS